MARFLLFLWAALVAPALPSRAQDAVQTDGDKYHLRLDNPCVRVLEYRDRPGEKTHQHHHPAFVLYALSAFERTLTLPNGTVLRRHFAPGDVMWSPAQTHIGENAGTMPTHVLLMEIKAGPGSAGSGCAPG